MGRKRIPEQVRKLTGARIRREQVTDEAARPKAGRPPMPKFLDPEARREWLRVVGLLLEMRALAETHRAALALYCIAWGNVADLARKLAAEKAAAVAAGGTAGDALIARRPSGLERTSATLQALHEAMAACQRHLAELGLSPTAQARILATRPDADGQLDLPGLADGVAARLQLLQGGRP